VRLPRCRSANDDAPGEYARDRHGYRSRWLERCILSHSRTGPDQRNQPTRLRLRPLRDTVRRVGRQPRLAVCGGRLRPHQNRFVTKTLIWLSAGSDEKCREGMVRLQSPLARRAPKGWPFTCSNVARPTFSLGKTHVSEARDPRNLGSVALL